MREHVGKAHECGLLVGIRSVVALNDRGDLLRQAPTTGEHAAHERVIDAKLAAFLLHALLGRASTGVHLRRVARVGMHEDELADVVQQRRDHQAIAVLVADLNGNALGGPLGRDAVQTEALGRSLPHHGALKEVKVRVCVASAWTASGESSSTACTTESTRPRLRPSIWLASRMTEITSATSDSTAATTAPTESGSSATTRSRRLRDSASAGKASSASNAAVRRRP